MVARFGRHKPVSECSVRRSVLLDCLLLYETPVVRTVPGRFLTNQGIYALIGQGNPARLSITCAHSGGHYHLPQTQGIIIYPKRRALSSTPEGQGIIISPKHRALILPQTHTGPYHLLQTSRALSSHPRGRGGEGEREGGDIFIKIVLCLLY